MAQININLPTPYPAQVPVFQACLDSTTKYVILSGGRQIGKSTICVISAIYWAYSKPNQHIMCVSKSDQQALLLQGRCIEILEPVFKLIVKKNKIAQGGAEIEFNNGSKILFRSAGSVDGLRGYSNTHLILDECSFFPEEIFKKILAPSMSVRGKNGKILFSSTPCGKNYFFNLFVKGQGQNKLYKSFKIVYDQNPYADLSLIEEERLTTHPDIFRQEYLGEFIDASSVFNNVDELSIIRKLAGPVPGDKYYAGIDIGLLNDFTVLSIINQRGEMCFMDRFTGVESPELINRLLNTIKLFKPISTLIENNNQGLPIYQQMARLQSGIVPFSTTAQSKPLLINELITAFSSKEIRVLDDAQVRLELQSYTFKQSATGRIQFTSPSGFHDDIVISIAIAWNCYKKFNNSNRYTIKTNMPDVNEFDKWIRDISVKGSGGGYTPPQ